MELGEVVEVVETKVRAIEVPDDLRPEVSGDEAGGQPVGAEVTADITD